MFRHSVTLTFDPLTFNVYRL